MTVNIPRKIVAQRSLTPRGPPESSHLGEKDRGGKVLTAAYREIGERQGEGEGLGIVLRREAGGVVGGP